MSRRLGLLLLVPHFALLCCPGAESGFPPKAGQDQPGQLLSGSEGGTALLWDLRGGNAAR